MSLGNFLRISTGEFLIPEKNSFHAADRPTGGFIDCDSVWSDIDKRQADQDLAGYIYTRQADKAVVC